MSDYLDFQIDFGAADTVSAYDELPLWSAMAGLLLLEHVELKRGAHVLDVGCGTGFPLIELAERLGPASRVCGIDPWSAALARARFKARVRRVENVAIVGGDAGALPFPDARFDLIVSNLGVNNFEKPEAALGEIRRVARPGSKLALTTNLKGHMKEFYDVFEETLAEVGDGKALGALKAHVNHRATVEKLTALLEGCGFRLARVREAQAAMRFADGSALLRHYFVKLGFLDGWKSVVEAERREDVFARLEGKLNQASRLRDGLELTIPLAYVEARLS
ncbi:MAG TPA: methyltransferase domain-containing protein [Thermoanaerobaculia bacterium]|nr:methyltransferase domain-containing protein [Thermoanaerobaculia bacterium]